MAKKKLESLAVEGRLEAIKYLLDQKFGKAPQRIEVTDEEWGNVIFNISGLCTKRLEQSFNKTSTNISK